MYDEGFLVEKRKGYRYPGVVVARFRNWRGDIRYVVENLSADSYGMLHIYSTEDLKPMEGPTKARLGIPFETNEFQRNNAP